MSDEQTPRPIDFSALDPGRNRLGWERTIQELAARAHADRARRSSVEDQLLRWARPVLAAAAGLCLVVWTTGYLVGQRATRAPVVETAQSPALTLAAWAAGDRIPDGDELFGALGGDL